MVKCARHARSLCHGLVVVALAAFFQVACQGSAPPEEATMESMEPHVTASDPVAAGRYLVIAGGCNDCHTDGYLQSEGNVPEDQWLTGSPVGWRGPWGTTYAKNLRMTVDGMTEDEFVEVLRTRKVLPPMPWMGVNQLSSGDVRAIYRYIRSLGVSGEAMPLPVPPDQEPATPYISLEPTMPAGG
jgi:mono/diheme cytochrome c family protein